MQEQNTRVKAGVFEHKHDSHPRWHKVSRRHRQPTKDKVQYRTATSPLGDVVTFEQTVTMKDTGVGEQWIRQSIL